jgi:hypothetical protein
VAIFPSGGAQIDAGRIARWEIGAVRLVSGRSFLLHSWFPSSGLWQPEDRAGLSGFGFGLSRKLVTLFLHYA